MTRIQTQPSQPRGASPRPAGTDPFEPARSSTSPLFHPSPKRSMPPNYTHHHRLPMYQKDIGSYGVRTRASLESAELTITSSLNAPP
ncbi:hypothetical protein B0T18DRAFT_184702 [Schizothecium vesticola]|uniref:Uncharacterized protein n=1 Tax=Schizothecium vesticola TaxID=314040 RepID=A0AA40EQ35_9PEZI|nr:hypothetical protein B0T18DRAFT_184702 [Schizothecium vesticola]